MTRAKKYRCLLKESKEKNASYIREIISEFF